MLGEMMGGGIAKLLQIFHHLEDSRPLPLYENCSYSSQFLAPSTGMINSHVPYIWYFDFVPDVLESSHENLTGYAVIGWQRLSGKGNMGEKKKHFGIEALRRKHSSLKNNLSFGRRYGLYMCVNSSSHIHLFWVKWRQNWDLCEALSLYDACFLTSHVSLTDCCNLPRVKGLVYWPKYYQLEHWTHFSFLSSQGEAKGGATQAGWKKMRKQGQCFFGFFFSSFFPLIGKQETGKDTCWTALGDSPIHLDPSKAVKYPWGHLQK